MLTIENQVTSPELSKCLFDFGVKKESLFYWFETLDGHYLTYQKKSIFNDKNWRIINEISHGIYSAFTVSELLELLPKGITIYNGINSNDYTKTVHYCLEYDDGNIQVKETNLCNALAKMLIHFLENKLLEIK